jgi:putative transposase
MPRKRHKPEEIVAKLRQVDVLVSQGHAVADAVRSIGVTEVTYYRWRQEFGGLKSDQVRRLKDLEAENTRLRRAVSDLMSMARGMSPVLTLQNSPVWRVW